jgi:hypothetical protein
MLVEGTMKVAILNHVQYLQTLNKFNVGSVLHPETIVAIENIHYCVNHNLPVSRIVIVIEHRNYMR